MIHYIKQKLKCFYNKKVRFLWKRGKRMACDYCAYRYSYDCDDGWNRHKNCENFKLDWDSLSEKDKKTIQKILDRRGD